MNQEKYQREHAEERGQQEHEASEKVTLHGVVSLHGDMFERD